MTAIPLEIVGGTSFDRYNKQSIERTYNMIISDGVLVDFPGYEKVLSIVPGKAQAREIYRSVKFEHMVAVIDEGVYIIDDNLAFGFIGNLDTQSGQVFISENNKGQIAITDKLFVYILNINTQGLEKITVDFTPGFIDFQDTYFICADLSSNEWRLSKQNDGTVWPAAGDPTGAQHIGALETKPDLMVATVRLNRQLFIMGQKTTEIWHDVGAQLFPYQRDNSISLDYGCLNASTIASGFGLLVWLATNEKAGPTIMVSTGGVPQQISTDGINFELDKLDSPEDSTAFLFEEDGHIFYLITFKSDNTSLVYDFNTQKFSNVTDERLNFHIAKRVAFFNKNHFFVSERDGDLYQLGTQFVTYKDTFDVSDPGHIIPRIRIPKPLRMKDAGRYSMTNLSLTLEQGQPLAIPGSLPAVDLSVSKDGGETFGTVVRRTFEGVAKRPNRLRYFGLGASNDTVFQFRFWGPSRFVVIGATVEVTQ